MTLKEKFAAALAEAKAAAERGDLVEARSQRERAELIKAAIDEAAQLDKLSGSVATEPVRPPLSGDSTQDNLFANQSANEGEGNGAMKAAYVMKFGETDSAIKGILNDLHGGDHAQMYYAQKSAFNKYMRRGAGELDSNEYRLLKQVIMTPSAVKSALLQGYTDVSFLKATMVEASDQLGGFTVPVDFQTSVIERLEGSTIVRGRARQMTTSRDRVELPKATGGNNQYRNNVRVTWTAETPAAGASNTNLTFGQEAVAVHTMMATTVLSRNLLEDAAFNLEPYLAESFASALRIEEDNKFLVGDGVGKPQGILPGALNSLALVTVNSGSNTALNFDKLQEVAWSIDSQYRSNCVWIMNKKTVLAIMQLKNSGGDYLWKPFQFGGAAEGRPVNLLGYPVLEQEVMSDIGASKFPILFCDLSGYMIVDRVGMTVERYLDSSTAEANTIKFIMRRRVGGQVLENWKFVAHQTAP